jgi:hypothetical protein
MGLTFLYTYILQFIYGSHILINLHLAVHIWVSHSYALTSCSSYMGLTFFTLISCISYMGLTFLYTYILQFIYGSHILIHLHLTVHKWVSHSYTLTSYSSYMGLTFVYTYILQFIYGSHILYTYILQFINGSHILIHLHLTVHKWVSHSYTLTSYSSYMGLTFSSRPSDVDPFL